MQLSLTIPCCCHRSVGKSHPTLCDPIDCSTPGFPVLHYLLEFAQTHVHWVGDAIQPSHPLSPSSPPALNLSQHQGLFQWILISFRIGWFDLLAMQGALRNLLQHHSSKAPILRCSAFFMVQLSHPYMTTGKIIALIRQTFVGKVMSLLFNMLSRFVIGFLPRSKCLLISWLQSSSTMILEPKKIKSAILSFFFFFFLPSICHEVIGLDVMIFIY